MKKELYIDHSFGEIRAAVVEDGALKELHHERIVDKKLTETIFLGRVEQIRPSFGAAFVDIGEELNAFLPLEDDYSLSCGDLVIVQGAAKQATETKGLRITDKINIAGKWLVLVPGGKGVHVSKKIKDPDLRDELLSAAQEICPQGCGLIVRTASEDVTNEALAEEASELHKLWKDIERKAASARKPCVLNERLPLELRLIRDQADKHLDSIVVNDFEMMQRLIEAQNAGHMQKETHIACFDEHDQLFFDVFGIENQIDKALKRRVWLPCGGYLIIDPCEALTVIDVNSGKMTLGRDKEDTAICVNLEAADEIARQIRLRDIGGIIIVDFIDMLSSSNRDALLKRMKEAVSADKSPVKLEGITKLGLLEMSRKRKGDSLSKRMNHSCTYCCGDGVLLTADEVAMRALRQVKRMMCAGQRGPFVIHCAAQVVRALSSTSLSFDAPIYAVPALSKHAERFDIEQIGEHDSLPKGALLLNKE